MALRDVWTDKVDEVDFVMAEDINMIANAVIASEDNIEDLIEHSNDFVAELEDTDNKVKANEKRILDLDRKVANLMGGYPEDLFLTDNSAKAIKPVPTNALPYAEVVSFGGISHKWEGYLPNYDADVSPMGSIYLSNMSIPVGAGTYVIMNFDTNEPYPYTTAVYYNGGQIINFPVRGQFEIPADTKITGVDFESTTLTNDVRLRVYIKNVNTGEIITFPNTFYLEPTKTTEIRSYGANLVDIGTVTFEYYKTYNVALEAGVTYYISTKITSNGSDTTTNQVDATYVDGTHHYLAISRNQRAKISFTPSKKVTSITLFAERNYGDSAGDTATYEDVMITTEDTDVYKPYRGVIDTIEIPQEIQALDGYGEGVNSTYYNKVDLENDTYGKAVKTLVFDGTENWELYDASGNFRLTVPLTENAYLIDDNTISLCVCNLYTAISVENSYLAETGVATASNRIFFYDDDYQTVTDWKAHLAELYANGTPLTVTYALQTPTTTPLPVEIDGIVEVEAGGYIELVNENMSDLPSEIDYMLKEI